MRRRGRAVARSRACPRSIRGRGSRVRAIAAARPPAQLEFDDNLLLPLLYGERDQHLDRIERAARRLAGARAATALAISRARPRRPRRRALALSQLYERLKRGPGDRLAGGRGRRIAALRRRPRAGDKSLSLWREDAGVPHPQAPHRARARRRRPPISRRCASTSWSSGWGRPAPARPISRSPPRSTC